MPRIQTVTGEALLLCIFGCALQVCASPSDSVGKPNILLVTVDTLRADHLGCYGNTAASTPIIDALANEGHLFAHAYAQVPLTLPSHYSILTGTFPFYHGVRDNSLGNRHGPPLVSEFLRRNGYRTGAFVGSFILDSRFGLDRGFDYYYDDFDLPLRGGTDLSHVERAGGEVIKKAIRWLGADDRPFFAWVHLFDPHDPYSPPEPFKSRFASSPYDGEIAYVDHAIGTLFEFLKKRGVFRRTHIILTSDHGEGLGDHGEYTHGLFLYDSTIHVPLIIRLANQPKAERKIDEVVRSLDIAPTVLQLVGIQPPAEMQGAGLLRLLSSNRGTEGRRAANERVSYCESYYPLTQFGWSPLFGIRTSRHQYIDAPHPELYDLTTDPGEEHNLFTERQALAAQLKSTLRAHVARYSGSRPLPQKKSPDPETIRLLHSLGYVASASYEGPPLGISAANRADPKDKVGIYSRTFKALAAANRGDAAAAARLLETVLKEDPGIVSARLLLGVQYEKLGQFSQAGKQYAATLADQSDNGLASFNLAQVCTKQGKLDEAVSWYRHTLRVDPAFTPAHIGLGSVYRSRQDWRNALDEFRAALAEEPRNYTAHYSLASIYGVTSQLDPALAHAREAVKIAPAQPEAYNLLGWILFLRKEMGEAETAFAKGAELDPRSTTVLTNLARVYAETGRTELARNTLKRALSIDPRYGVARQLLARLDHPERD